jgi:integral membrane protein
MIPDFRRKTPIGFLRVVAFIEGWSYLLLLGVAMPLKYFADLPLAVRIVGSVHGALFLLFCAALSRAMLAARWSIPWAGVVFASSLVPFGTFLIDGRLKREDEAGSGSSPARRENDGASAAARDGHRPSPPDGAFTERSP